MAGSNIIKLSKVKRKSQRYLTRHNFERQVQICWAHFEFESRQMMNQKKKGKNEWYSMLLQDKAKQGGGGAKEARND